MAALVVVYLALFCYPDRLHDPGLDRVNVSRSASRNHGLLAAGDTVIHLLRYIAGRSSSHRSAIQVHLGKLMQRTSVCSGRSKSALTCRHTRVRGKQKGEELISSPLALG